MRAAEENYTQLDTMMTGKREATGKVKQISLTDNIDST
jgi:hypothetical protein